MKLLKTIGSLVPLKLVKFQHVTMDVTKAIVIHVYVFSSINCRTLYSHSSRYLGVSVSTSARTLPWAATALPCSDGRVVF